MKKGRKKPWRWDPVELGGTRQVEPKGAPITYGARVGLAGALRRIRAHRHAVEPGPDVATTPYGLALILAEVLICQEAGWIWHPGPFATKTDWWTEADRLKFVSDLRWVDAAPVRQSP